MWPHGGQGDGESHTADTQTVKSSELSARRPDLHFFQIGHLKTTFHSRYVSLFTNWTELDEGLCCVSFCLVVMHQHKGGRKGKVIEENIPSVFCCYGTQVVGGICD